MTDSYHTRRLHEAVEAGRPVPAYLPVPPAAVGPSLRGQIGERTKQAPISAALLSQILHLATKSFVLLCDGLLWVKNPFARAVYWTISPVAGLPAVGLTLAQQAIAQRSLYVRTLRADSAASCSPTSASPRIVGMISRFC